MYTNYLAKPSILLVDDKPENLFVLDKLLTPLDATLFKATSGNEALSIALEQPVMLMLLDVHMPEMDGYEVLELMYSDDRLKKIPVIFVTAYYTDEHHRLRGYQLGAVDYLYKPIDEEILLSKVKVFLELYNRQQEYVTLQQRNQLILDSAGEGIFGLDKDGKINFANPAAAMILGRGSEELVNISLENIISPKVYSPQKYQWFDTEIYQASSSGYFHRVMDSVFITKDEAEIPVDYVVTSIRGAGDSYMGAVVVFTNATPRKLNEKTEKQLYQAQKMESVGQLTGGLAHDFNNILMAIQGNLELLSDDFDANSVGKRRINSALSAAERGSMLTKRMLAFARKQTLFPEKVNVDEQLKNLVALLAPTLGELITIKLECATDLRDIWVDPGQLESALVNLSINARDAMPNGGSLYFETSNIAVDEVAAVGRYQVPPGHYVKISITDEGTGISHETQEHIFEPFFTTKEPGKGTGLGLSMVYGFVKQSGGSVTVYSEVGHGTTFNLYLPSVQAGDEAAEMTIEKLDSVGAVTDEPCHETILVVEDEDFVRELAVEYLSNLGYKVLFASSGSEALAIINQEKNIDLLFTDVVMPGGISGPELATEAVKLIPNLKILLTSGYPKAALTGNHNITSEEHMLKPYKLAALATRLRKILQN